MERTEDDRNRFAFVILQVVRKVSNHIQELIVLLMLVSAWKDVGYNLALGVVEAAPSNEIRHMSAQGQHTAFLICLLHHSDQIIPVLLLGVQPYTRLLLPLQAQRIPAE
ncbi:hypothetical protein D3C75_519700 [compost metagenome]